MKKDTRSKYANDDYFRRLRINQILLRLAILSTSKILNDEEPDLEEERLFYELVYLNSIEKNPNVAEFINKQLKSIPTEEIDKLLDAVLINDEYITEEDVKEVFEEMDIRGALIPQEDMR